MTTETKLDDYSKPFKQGEVNYVMTAPSAKKRCATCRFFKHKNNYDPCLMLRNDTPFPIVEGGTCDLYNVASYSDVVEDPGYDGDAVSAAARLAMEQVDLEQPSGLKVIKTGDKIYWIGWYSNNFEDLEGDIFAEEGLDFQNRMVSKKLWDPPELWSMHQEYLRHGKALLTFRLGHFQFALGEFDDVKENPLVEPFVKYYEENPVTMSHGFFYDPDKYEDGVFYRWRTFEVSTIKPGREANPLTQFSIEKVDKMLTGKDREFVEKIIGKEKLEDLEKSADSRGMILTDAGLAFKAAGDDEEDEEMEDDEKDPKKDPKKKPPFKKASVEEVVMIAAMQKMYGDMQDAIENATKIANIAAAAMTQSDERMSAVETKLSRLNISIQEVLDPGSASKSKNTLVPDDDKAAELLIQKNHPGGDGKERKSLLEELAIQLGDDPSIYKK